MVVGLASQATIALSLDTTAVPLTQVALSLARQLGLPPLGFAKTTVCLANTAGMLPPVSNPTNLLAQDSRLRRRALMIVAALVIGLLAAASFRRSTCRGRPP